MAGLQDFLGTATTPVAPVRLPAQLAMVQSPMQGPPMPPVQGPPMAPTGLASYVGPQAAGPTSLALQDQARTNYANGDTATAVGNTIGAAVSGMGHALAAPFVDLDQARAADAQSLGRTVSHFAGGLFGVQPAAARALPAQVAAQPPAVAAPAAPVVAPAAAAPAVVPAPASVTSFVGQPVGAPGSLPAAPIVGNHIIRDGTGGGPLVIGVDHATAVPAQGLGGLGGAQNGLEKALDAPAGATNLDLPRGALQRAEVLSKMAQVQTAAMGNSTQAQILRQFDQWRKDAEVKRQGETPADYDTRVNAARARYTQQMIQFLHPAAITAIPTSNTFSPDQ